MREGASRRWRVQATDPPEAGPALSPAARLPRQLTSFVGRSRELAQLTRALEDHRLVTACGPGGAGKTRLALEAAHQLRERYPDGVFLVELAEVSDPSLVPGTVAAAAGIPERPELGVTTTLLEALSDARTLLVLDNCEHLLDACAELAFTLLEGCPRPQVLATSREPLQVPGEVVLRLPPLPRPPLSGGPSDPTRLASYDAVRLFLDRAETFNPGFVLGPQNAAAVARVCALTEGIPLLIELAAGRLTTLTVNQIADQLDHALNLLEADAGHSPARHRTLRAAVDWSYRRLSRAERTLFARLSVFAGPPDLEAVRAVCADSTLLASEVMDTLLRLVDRSLLQVEGGEGGLRFRLLEVLRQFAAEKLAAAGETETMRARHAAHFGALVERAARDQRRGALAPWVRRLEEERPNLRASLNWSLEADPRLALRLAAALSWHWHTVGSLAEGRRWLEMALAASVDDPRLRALALHGSGRIAYRQGDNRAALSLLEQALELHRAGGRELEAAQVLRSLGLVLLSEGDFAGARARLQEALGIVRRLDARLDEERTLGSLAQVAMAESDHEAAQAWLEAALDIAEQLDDDWGRGTSIGSLGELALERGDLDAAFAHLARSLGILRPLGAWSGVAYRLEGLARLAAARGRHERALRLAAAAAALRRRLGDAAVPHWRQRLEQALAGSRGKLTPESAEQAEAEGRRMPLEEAIELALREKEGAAPQFSREPPHWASPRARASGLADPEWEALGLIVLGLPNRAIAARLGVTAAEAKAVVSAVLRKLGARTRAQAIAAALGLEAERPGI